LVIPPSGIDVTFLRNLNTLIRKKVREGIRFLLVVGGGRTARNYPNMAKRIINKVKDEDLDWLGIHATRLNAQLLRTIFKDIAHPRIIMNYDKRIVNWKEPVAIGAGWKPGWSTDYDAVVLARDYHASMVINLSNIDGVYDCDPHKFKKAKRVDRITWKEMRKMFGCKWSPGLNTPFDPISIGLAKKIGLTAVVAGGQDFENIDNIIKDKPFKGTVIMPSLIASRPRRFSFFRFENS